MFLIESGEGACFLHFRPLWTNLKILNTGPVHRITAVYFLKYVGTKFYCLMTETRVSKQLV